MWRNFVAAAALLGSVSAKIYLPEKKHDQMNWRLLPILPYVFLNDTLYYVIFSADDGNYVMTIRGKIDNNSGDFESHLDDLRGKNFVILWRQDWFVIDRFKWLAQDAYLFPDAREHAQLVATGAEALKANDIDKLRAVVAHLDSVRIGSGGDDEMMAGANIVRS